MNFRGPRNIELSTIFYIRTELDATWTSPTINVVKTHKQAYATALPIVCIGLTNINPIPKEIGNTTRRNSCGIDINIFATSDGQRLDLASHITDLLNSGWVYYVYSNASGQDNPNKTSDGRVRLMTYIQNQKVEFGDEVESHDRFRHIISIIVEKS